MKWRNDDVSDAGMQRERGRVHRAAAAESDHRELGRRAAELARHRLDSAHHRRVGDRVDAPGGLDTGFDGIHRGQLVFDNERERKGK